jgi:hypothetical protein
LRDRNSVNRRAPSKIKLLQIAGGAKVTETA